MKATFKAWFNAMLALLALALCWSVWQSWAQTNLAGTNSAGTNAPAPQRASPFKGVETEVAHVIPDESGVTPDWINDLAGSFPFLKDRFLGNEVWKWLASLVYIFLAFYGAKFIDYLARVWLKQWSERTGTKIEAPMYDLLNGPVKVVTFIIFLHVGLDVLEWPPKAQAWLAKGFTVVAAAAVTYMALKLVDLLVAAWRRRAQGQGAADLALDDQLFPVVRKSLKTFVVVVAVLVTAQNLKIDITAALASLSIGGLAVGLAAQDTLANLFGAMVVFMDKPFRLGDHILTDGGVDGTVESIGVRSTRVRNGKGYLVTIPNKSVGNATITNISRRPNIQGDVSLALAYDTTAEKLKQALAILREVYVAEPMVQGLQVTFDRFKESAPNLHVGFTWNAVDDAKYDAATHQLNLRVQELFESAGIRLMVPVRTVYLKQDSEGRMAAGEDQVAQGLG